MKKAVMSLVLVTLTSAVSVKAASTLEGTCDIEYDVKATMDSFTGTAVSEPVTMTIEDGKASWDVVVPVMNMLTGNKKRDKEMYHMFHSEEHGFINGAASAVDLGSLNEETAELPFSITIAGVTHDLVAQISDYQEDDEQMSFTAAFDVALKDFGLTPPSVLKIIRVKNLVNVRTAFTFAK